ncbi:GAF domain-containing sensor histidine kinase [Pararhizobium arenae]|uniref:GAF domain-containing sensor histidine kinase n=1 Tax=Pararhizobium arenae TaxID=1856850 RepID=UPI00094B529F|nr:GAF domain-containing sensor histidine kinase [Pararhizobium arenae]
MADLTGDLNAIGEIPSVSSILDVVTKVTGMGFAAVARVTEDRWVACEVLDNIDFGLKPGGELRIETTICNDIRDTRQVVVIHNVAEDSVYCRHHTPAMYGFQSYISMPIVLSDGTFFGTLCAIDPKPRHISTEVVEMFRLFAELIAVHIYARAKLIASQRELAEERNTAELREQFIAVLGHDLRNPLTAISGGTQILLRRTEDEKSRSVLQMMAAGAQRMGALIENVMDFARGRLGGGIVLQTETKPLEPTLSQVVSEIASAWPDRDIRYTFDLAHPFEGDHVRLGQLFSNLLGNAVTHGEEGSPITVEAVTSPEGFKLSVANAGKRIDPSTIERLFRPFERGGEHSVKGLGLGLYIASEIARAHGGKLEVKSDDEETRFTLTAPASIRSGEVVQMTR